MHHDAAPQTDAPAEPVTIPAPDPAVLYDLLVVGGGPAGLNAALYASRKGLKVGLLARHRGGQVTDTYYIDNYLGLDNVAGAELAERFAAHLDRYGVPFLEDAKIVGYEPSDGVHQVTLSSGETFRGRTLIIATGTNYRALGIPGERAFGGLGVSYCVTCDAPLFRNKDVFVAGGGNAAVEAALDLAKIARSVTLVHRSQLRADAILVDLLYANPKITVHLRTRILEVLGDDFMSGLRVEDLESGGQRTLQGVGLFVEIGRIPNSRYFRSHLDLNEYGEIIVSDRMETNIPGVFAAGDVTNFPYKQIVVAASQGAIAALAANDYIYQKKPDENRNRKAAEYRLDALLNSVESV